MTPIKITISAKNGKYTVKATLPLLRKEKDGYYFVQCPALKTIGYSNVSYAAAIKDHKVELDLFFKVHIARKTIKTALNSLGWKKTATDDYGFLDRKIHLQKPEMIQTSLLATVAA